MPRYLAAIRPGHRSLVLEVDPGVVALDREQLALRPPTELRVRVADARMALADEPAGRATWSSGTPSAACRCRGT